MLVLHDYWRSGAAYRVRIALALKGVDYKSTPHNLLTGEQTGEAYRRVNPLGLVPALDIDGQVLTQSMAIIEWLEERYPEPPLLPRCPFGRAQVRAIAQAIACDIHPLNNLRVLQSLDVAAPGRPELRGEWIARWMNSGFVALESTLKRTAGIFAFGDSPGLADCLLVPQAYAAQRYQVPLAPYPTLARVVKNANTLTAFRLAHPDNIAQA